MASFTYVPSFILVVIIGSTLASPTRSGTGNPYQTQSVGGTCPPNNPQLNKKLVLTAYHDAIVNRNPDLEQYYHPDYIQHNPWIPDGLEALKNFAKDLPKDEGKPDFKRVAADGDLVWLHVDMKIMGVQYAIVDIFRIECGKIKEHWDVLQDTKSVTNPANSHPFW